MFEVFKDFIKLYTKSNNRNELFAAKNDYLLFKNKINKYVESIHQEFALFKIDVKFNNPINKIVLPKSTSLVGDWLGSVYIKK